MGVFGILNDMFFMLLCLIVVWNFIWYMMMKFQVLMMFSDVMFSMILNMFDGMRQLSSMLIMQIVIVIRMFVYGMDCLFICVRNVGVELFIDSECNMCFVEYRLELRFDSVVVSIIRFIIELMFGMLSVLKNVMNGFWFVLYVFYGSRQISSMIDVMQKIVMCQIMLLIVCGSILCVFLYLLVVVLISLMFVNVNIMFCISISVGISLCGKNLLLLVIRCMLVL